VNEQLAQDLDRRLRALENTAVRYRAGEITGTAPLDVALGGSDTSFEDVAALTADMQVGDIVAALTWGNDLLVLGKLTPGWRFGSDSMTWTASTDSGPKTISHGLGVTPRFIVVTNAATEGSYAGIASFTTLNAGASTFDVYGRTPGSISATKAIYWLAIA
jgi:hypothetical protein